MDVNDLKGLFGEVTKRMGVVIEHVRHELVVVLTRMQEPDGGPVRGVFAYTVPARLTAAVT